MAEPLPERGPAILRLAAPLVISFWFRATFQWVDTVYASRLGTLPGAVAGGNLGDASIAAIGLTVPFEFALIACWVGASNGLTSRLSAALGAREGERVTQLLGAATRIVVVLCAVFVTLAAAIYLLAERVGLDPLVARQFRVYGSVLVGGSALTAFWSILPDSIVKAHQDTRSTMWAGLISTTLNVVLNTIFVFVLGWGIFGIALGTVLGRLGGLAYALRVAARHERQRRWAGRDTRPGTYARPGRAILALAAPGGAGFLLLAFEGLAINALLATTREAESSLAAWSIFDRAVRFLSMPVVASSVALLPLVAQLHGAGRRDRVRLELRTVLVAGAAYAVLIVTPIALLAGPPFAAWLSDAPRTAEKAIWGFYLVPLAVLVSAPMFQLRALFEGLQRPRPGLVVSLLRALVLVVPLSAAGLPIARALGVEPMLGVYVGFTVGAGLASAALAALAWRGVER